MGENMDSKKKYYKPVFENIPVEKRSKILSVALNEFATKGFESANVNLIANRSGVSIGSIYKYFASKKDLFLTVVSDGIGALETILNEISSSSGDIMEKLEKLVRTAVDYSRKQTNLIKLYYEITAESNADIVHEIAEQTEAAAAKVYIEAIEEGQKNGTVRADLDPKMAAFLLDSLIMVIEFSYTCDYYSERFKIFAGDDIFQKDSYAVEAFLKFVKSALEP